MEPSGFNKIVIAIQARTGSTRFPGKCWEMVGPKAALLRVLDSAHKASGNFNRYERANGNLAAVALCIPENDPIKSKYFGTATIIEGPEDDVLARFKLVIDRMQADYVVRITADCPLISTQVIRNHMILAIKNQYDYLSNVDEKCRTSADGMDCEVISKKMLLFMADNAFTPYDREHVTPFARNNELPWAKRGFVMNTINQKSVKLSLDTPEDLERIRAMQAELEEARETATKIYGQTHVHTFG